VRAVLAKDPTLTKQELAKAANVSDSTASKSLRILEEERAQRTGQVEQ
jgi:predicted transcriptional regulator